MVRTDETPRVAAPARHICAAVRAAVQVSSRTAIAAPRQQDRDASNLHRLEIADRGQFTGRR